MEEKIRAKLEELRTMLQADGGDLDVVEIAMEIEEHFEISIPDEISERTRTVANIADGVLQLLD